MTKQKMKEYLLNSSNIPKKIYFGDKFQLVRSFSSIEFINRDRTVSKIIHLLFKSMTKQKMKEYLLNITLLKNQKSIHTEWIVFGQPGSELEAGDYIFGNVIVPADTFKRSKFLGIRMHMHLDPRQPKKWIRLKIHGNHRTGQDGFRLVIPVKNINK